jgi:hypothetical protein
MPLVIGTGALCVLVTFGYAALSPVLREHEDARPMAGQIKRAVHPEIPLYVQDSGFRQFWYYLEPEAQFFWGPSELRWNVEVEPRISLLLPREKADRFLKEIEGVDKPGVEKSLILETQDRRGDEYELWLLNRLGRE